MLLYRQRSTSSTLIGKVELDDNQFPYTFDDIKLLLGLHPFLDIRPGSEIDTRASCSKFGHLIKDYYSISAI